MGNRNLCFAEFEIISQFWSSLICTKLSYHQNNRMDTRAVVRFTQNVWWNGFQHKRDDSMNFQCAYYGNQCEWARKETAIYDEWDNSLNRIDVSHGAPHHCDSLVATESASDCTPHFLKIKPDFAHILHWFIAKCSKCSIWCSSERCILTYLSAHPLWSSWRLLLHSICRVW